MTGSKPVRVKIGYRREVNRQSPFSPQEIWIVRKIGTDSERAPKEREEEREERCENRVPYHINKEKSTTQVTIKLSTTSLVAAKDS